MKTCLKCNTVFENASDIKADSMCPIKHCMGEIVDIDELYLPIIIQLNKKGYETIGCCSGHYFSDRRPYIKFFPLITPKHFPKIPGNFFLDEEDGCVIIATILKNVKEPLIAHKELLSLTSELTEWANKLSSLERFGVLFNGIKDDDVEKIKSELETVYGLHVHIDDDESNNVNLYAIMLTVKSKSTKLYNLMNKLADKYNCKCESM